MNKLKYKSLFQNIAIALGIAIFFMTDRWLKALALTQAAAPGRSLIGHLLAFKFIPNYYMAFSLPVGGWLLNALIIIIISALLSYIFYLSRQGAPKKLEIGLLILILAGALSNIYDRLTYGYVIDYWFMKYFTVFNLADAMISAGALLLILINLRNK